MADKTTKKAPAKTTEKSLQEQLKDARHDLLEAKKSHRSGELVNPKVLGGYRKEIARLMTKLNAKKEGK
jgi:ribosomal protein L29